MDNEFRNGRNFLLYWHILRKMKTKVEQFNYSHLRDIRPCRVTKTETFIKKIQNTIVEVFQQ